MYDARFRPNEKKHQYSKDKFSLLVRAVMEGNLTALPFQRIAHDRLSSHTWKRDEGLPPGDEARFASTRRLSPETPIYIVVNHVTDF